jgi:hypothetical protein
MAAYCVVLRGRVRNKRIYLTAEDAQRAMRIATEDNPGCSVVGIEPRKLFPPLSQEQPVAVSGSQHAA